MYSGCFFFFFQAEDGIRDGHVTGVQTCALPICSLAAPPASEPARPARESPPASRGAATVAAEIGRASCRERVENSVVGRSSKKTRTFPARLLIWSVW